jgi:predicted nucleotidyltransferase
MISLVESKREEVALVCRKYRVRRLGLFGSAARGVFDPEKSDLDFLADFEDRAPTGSYAARVLDFSEALEKLFGRRVDVVIEQSVRNPFFRKVIESQRESVYEG